MREDPRVGEEEKVEIEECYKEEYCQDCFRIMEECFCHLRGMDPPDDWVPPSKR